MFIKFVNCEQLIRVILDPYCIRDNEGESDFDWDGLVTSLFSSVEHIG